MRGTCRWQSARSTVLEAKYTYPIPRPQGKEASRLIKPLPPLPRHLLPFSSTSGLRLRSVSGPRCLCSERRIRSVICARFIRQKKPQLLYLLDIAAMAAMRGEKVPTLLHDCRNSKLQTIQDESNRDRSIYCTVHGPPPMTYPLPSSSEA